MQCRGDDDGPESQDSFRFFMFVATPEEILGSRTQSSFSSLLSLHSRRAGLGLVTWLLSLESCPYF